MLSHKAIIACELCEAHIGHFIKILITRKKKAVGSGNIQYPFETLAIQTPNNRAFHGKNVFYVVHENSKFGHFVTTFLFLPKIQFCTFLTLLDAYFSAFFSS